MRERSKAIHKPVLWRRKKKQRCAKVANTTNQLINEWMCQQRSIVNDNNQEKNINRSTFLLCFTYIAVRSLIIYKWSAMAIILNGISNRFPFFRWGTHEIGRDSWIFNLYIYVCIDWLIYSYCMKFEGQQTRRHHEYEWQLCWQHINSISTLYCVHVFSRTVVEGGCRTTWRIASNDAAVEMTGRGVAIRLPARNFRERQTTNSIVCHCFVTKNCIANTISLFICVSKRNARSTTFNRYFSRLPENLIPRPKGSVQQSNRAARRIRDKTKWFAVWLNHIEQFRLCIKN